MVQRLSACKETHRPTGSRFDSTVWKIYLGPIQFCNFNKFQAYALLALSSPDILTNFRIPCDSPLPHLCIVSENPINNN